ncbi:MAG: TonB-dependent receptor [Bacteroidales bacterium]|nr:TonB-dependent receptor [Bacteroidales bacterium]MBN2757058.1 TonB-dependent receptor [Bacteroidales bacterium]
MNKYILTIISILLSYNLVAQNAILKGKITDVSNNQPVPFANVIVVGTQIGSTSDFDGNFIITGLNPGYVKLQISFIGYKTKISSDILLSNDKIPFIEINLEPTDEIISEVVVKADPFEKKQESPIAMQSIGIKEIEGNPGSNRDISRVIQSFPGVGSTPAFRNDVIIRGGGPSENRFFLDGVEIPVLNHFSTQGASGGPVGIINADFIQNVDFYSGSFPANKYNALSGILDFRQKEGNKDKTSYQATLGASETAFTIDGPIGEKISYIFSVRKSYLQFLFEALELPFLPTFNDYQLKLKYNIDNKNQITVISIGSLDFLKLNDNIKNPDASQEYILSQIPVNNQWSYTFGTVYKHFTENGFHTFVLSRNMLNNQFYKYPDNNENLDKSFDYLSTEAENKLRYEYTTLKNGVKYNFGLNLEYAKYYNSTSQQVFYNEAIINLNYKTNLDIFKYGLSAQASKTVFNENLLMSFGIRTDANNYNDNMNNPVNQLSPRFSLSYSLAKNTLLNAGIGRFFQQAAYTTLGFRDNSEILINQENAKYIGANHYNLSLEHRLSKSIILSLEGFYKDYFQYPIDLTTGASLANQGADYSSVAGATEVDFYGTGKAVGFEFLNRINYNKFTLLASYTYVRSQFTDINNKLISSAWDSKHLLTITGSQEFKNNWRVGFKWRFVGGLPYTPYDLETSANIQAWNAKGQAYLDYNNLNSLRFNAFHQLDIRIDKNYFFNKWSLMLYIDIQNAYNFKNTGQDYIVREKNADGTYQTTNNNTEYVLKAVENKSGTVLPTIGIMVKF